MNRDGGDDFDPSTAALAADTGLACTTATGIISLCAIAAETWRRIDGRAGT